MDGEEAIALEERRLEERRRLGEADERRQGRREEENMQRSATVIQATYRGKQDRAVAAARAPKPTREWRFAKSSVRGFTTQEGGHNSATFFVHRHEKLEIAEVEGQGRLMLTATDTAGTRVVTGGVVYDSSAHAFISASSPDEIGGDRGKALWSAPGEYEYHFTLHPLDRSVLSLARALSLALARARALARALDLPPSLASPSPQP